MPFMTPSEEDDDWDEEWEEVTTFGEVVRSVGIFALSFVVVSLLLSPASRSIAGSCMAAVVGQVDFMLAVVPGAWDSQ